MSVFPRFQAKKVGAISMLTALALIAFLLESLLPALFIPGAKAGLSNVFSLLALVIYGPFEAVLVVGIRTILGSIIVGNPAVLLYSLTAGEISVLFASFLFVFFKDRLSVVAISVSSAVMHNTVQLLVYRIITLNTAVYAFFPYLIVLGTIAGLIVGTLSLWTVKGIPSPVFERLFNER